ncbi:MAG: hypothetical protein CMI11_06615 [Oceanospirillales bacterium]|nr:hypothetical protein [Marinobacter sp.]MBI43149.1 hypothetical protein [Oceanospirillales bacterium]
MAGCRGGTSSLKPAGPDDHDIGFQSLGAGQWPGAGQHKGAAKAGFQKAPAIQTAQGRTAGRQVWVVVHDGLAFLLLSSLS